MTRNILLALSTTHHGFLRGVAGYARQRNWHINAVMSYTGKLPHGWSGDGVISHCAFSDELAGQVNAVGLPTVEITSVNEQVRAARIDADYAAFGREAAEHFLARRFKRFAVAPLADDRLNEQRLHGFIARIGREGHTATHLPPLVEDRGARVLDWRARTQKLRALLADLPKPVAVFAYNDAVGVDIIKACQDISLLVPEQVAVVGVDNDELLCEASPVPLSSVRFDLAELGRQAAAFLDDILDGRSRESCRLVSAGAGIVTRRSSEVFAVDNVHVAKACRLIATHLTDPGLSVSAVAEHAGLTERGLRKAFVKHLGRTVHEEIALLRHLKVCELLRHTGLTIKEIAAATGFSGPNYLTRAFRHRSRVSPSDYRRQAGTH